MEVLIISRKEINCILINETVNYQFSSFLIFFYNLYNTLTVLN